MNRYFKRLFVGLMITCRGLISVGFGLMTGSIVRGTTLMSGLSNDQVLLTYLTQPESIPTLSA